MTRTDLKQWAEFGANAITVWREARRREHHHEIFKLVLDHTLVRGLETVEQMGLTTPEAIIAMCRKYADLAYPQSSTTKDQA